MNIKDFETSNVYGPYVLYGEEKYLIDKSVEYLVKRYFNEAFDDFNIIYFQGRDWEIDSLINACETLPLMSEKKLVIVKNAGEFFNSFDNNDNFFDFLKNIGEYCILLFLEGNEKINKVKKLYKYLKKQERQVEFSKLKIYDLNVFIENYFNQKGKKINRATASYISERSNYLSRNLNITLLDLINEMDKIIMGSSRGIVTREDIDATISNPIDENIFDFLNALSEKNKGKSLIYFNNLYELNEPIQRTFIMLVRQVRLLLSYKLLRYENYSDAQIRQQMGIKPYELKKISAHSGNFTKEFLRDFYYKLAKADKLFKTTSANEFIILEKLILEFCQ